MQFFALRQDVIFIPPIFQVEGKVLTVEIIRILPTGPLTREITTIIRNGTVAFLVIFQDPFFIMVLGILPMEMLITAILPPIRRAGKTTEVTITTAEVGILDYRMRIEAPIFTMDRGVRHMEVQIAITAIQNPQDGNGTRQTIIIIQPGIAG